MSVAASGAAAAAPVVENTAIVTPRVPSDLQNFWRNQSQTTGQRVVHFYGHDDQKRFSEFSNFFEHTPFTFEIPRVCWASGQQELARSVPVAFTEKVGKEWRHAMLDFFLPL